MTASAGARRYYDAQRARGKTHNQALRALANRLVSILPGCLEYVIHGLPSGTVQLGRKVPANTCHASRDFAISESQMKARSP